MLTKLAMRSFLRQFRNYAVYFVSMVMAVMVYYSFSAMTNDQPLIQGTSQDLDIAGFLQGANFFVLLIILFFVLSANRFFIKRRRQEIALYQLFGAKKYWIVAQFLLETFLLNVVAFLLGILLGIVFSKLFAMILVRAMGLAISSHFFISEEAIRLAASVFFDVFLVITIQNIWLVPRGKLQDLFDKRSQWSMKKAGVHWGSWLLGILGGGMLLAGWGIGLFLKPLVQWVVTSPQTGGVVILFPILAVFLCIVGTYLFFRFTIKLLLYLLGKTPLAYHSLRFYDFSKSRVAILKNWRNLSLVTVLTSLAIIVIGLGIYAVSFLTQAEQDLNPVAYQVGDDQLPQLTATIQQAGGRIQDQWTFHYKLTGLQTDDRFLNDGNQGSIKLINLLAQSDYQRYQQANPSEPAVELMSPQEAVLFDLTNPAFVELGHTSDEVRLPQNTNLQLQARYNDSLGDDKLRYAAGVLVVTDDVFAAAAGHEYGVTFLNVADISEADLGELTAQEMTINWQDDIYYSFLYEEGRLVGEVSQEPVTVLAPGTSFDGEYSRMNLQSRYPTERTMRRTAGIIVYVAIFIGMVGSLITASVLMLRRISEAEEEVKDFRLLMKVGVTKEQVKRMIYRQEAWFFFLPVVLISLHAGIAINSVASFLDSQNYWLAYLFIGIMALLYTIAYLMTVFFYHHTLENQ